MSVTIESILQLLEVMSPAIVLLTGLFLGMNILHLVMSFSDIDRRPLGRAEQSVAIRKLPSWVIEENKHRARVERYANRIHHHRARVSKRASRKP
jgi:hypothetical protein